MRLVAEAEPVHHAGPELLQHDVGALGEQRQHAIARGRVLEVGGDALLAAVEQREVDALLPPARLVAAHLLALARPLDLEHLGAGLGQQQRGQRPRQQRREIEDADAVERAHHASAISRALLGHHGAARRRIGRRAVDLEQRRRHVVVVGEPAALDPLDRAVADSRGRAGRWCPCPWRWRGPRRGSAAPRCTSAAPGGRRCARPGPRTPPP